MREIEGRKGEQSGAARQDRAGTKTESRAGDTGNQTCSVLPHMISNSKCYLYPILHRGLNQKVAYGCLNDNQEEGTPANLFSLALVAVPPLSPACEPG
ncbi:hypothetical protein NQZ68_003471 [Dissostichus eleginoides]|nr:hypothetical protein NQZ68_003471 [Dissostichus eleginoides]